MQGPGTLTLSKADLIRAVEYWLNAQQLHEPVVVEDVQQHSAKSRTPECFDVEFRSQASEGEGGASSYPVGSE